MNRLREHFSEPILAEPSRTRYKREEFEDEGEELQTRHIEK
jgi:hypothetical protein